VLTIIVSLQKPPLGLTVLCVWWAYLPSYLPFRIPRAI